MPPAGTLRVGCRVGVIGVAGLQLGKTGVETMDECEEADIELLLDGGGKSQLSRTGKSQGGSLIVNDDDGPIRRASLRLDWPGYGRFLDHSAFELVPS